MKKYKIWLSPPHLSGKESEFIQEAIKSNWLTTMGRSLEDFEKELCKKFDYPYVCCLNSGTSAIHLALKLLNIQKNDEVICPSLTFVASANPILYESARPVFIDSEEESWNISPEWLEIAIQDRINRGKKPKAIVVVHLYGNASKMKEIQSISEKYGIPIIEDNAEALGSRYQNRSLGSFGALSVLSFNGNKIITTSAGGALVCSSKEQHKKTKYLAHQAKSPLPYYHHEELGYNYGMSNLLAAIGLAQLTNFEERVLKKRKIFEIYFQELIQTHHLEYPQEIPNSFSTRWLSVLLLPEQYSPHELVRFLEKQGIESRRLWKPLHLQPIFENYPFYGNHFCTHLFERGVCLPSGVGLTETEQHEIIRLVKEFLKK